MSHLKQPPNLKPVYKPMKRTTSAAAFITSFLLATVSLAGPREDFLKLIDRPKVPLDFRTEAPTTQDASKESGLSQTRFTFAADAQQRVPGNLIKLQSSTGRRPVVIMLHGTGGTQDDEAPFRRSIAEKGFISVAIDGRYHGLRTKARSKGTADYFAAIVRAWKDGKEHPFYYDTVWDVMRLVDYLQTRDDVDPARIGLMGISKGGTETYLTAAVDTRIAAVVPFIGVQSFKWALDNDTWQPRIGTIQAGFNEIAKDAGIEKPDAAFVRIFYDRVMPGVYGEFDGPSMLPLIAPRPLMTVNGELDDRTPLPGLKECTDAAAAAYKSAGKEDRFVVRIQPNTPHRVNPDSREAATEFFIKWLKP